MITEKRLEEFKILYKKRFNKDLTDQEALEQATQLISLMKVVYRPLPENNKS